METPILSVLEKNIVNVNKDFNYTSSYNECNTIYMKIIYIITCCNFSYSFPLYKPGYLYCCGNSYCSETIINPFGLCCCCLYCFTCYSDTCRKIFI